MLDPSLLSANQQTVGCQWADLFFVCLWFQYNITESCAVWSFSVTIIFCLQDLEFLCEGLEGRSPNPVALLFDALSHPEADLGADNSTVLDWKHEEQYEIPHVVLGKTRAGGSWQVCLHLVNSQTSSIRTTKIKLKDSHFCHMTLVNLSCLVGIATPSLPILGVLNLFWAA